MNFDRIMVYYTLGSLGSNFVGDFQRMILARELKSSYLCRRASRAAELNVNILAIWQNRSISRRK